jgi:quinol monooxygenase YgiN
MGKVACITTIKAAPGRRDELLKLCKAHVKLMLAAEPGTLRIELLAPLDDTDRLIVWDVYENMEALEAHRIGEQLRRFVDDAKEIIVSMSGVRHTLIE